MFVINNEKSYISDDGVPYFTTNKSSIYVSKENKNKIVINNSVYKIFGMRWQDLQKEEKVYFIYR